MIEFSFVNEEHIKAKKKKGFVFHSVVTNIDNSIINKRSRLNIA